MVVESVGISNPMHDVLAEDWWLRVVKQLLCSLFYLRYSSRSGLLSRGPNLQQAPQFFTQALGIWRLFLDSVRKSNIED